MIINYIARTNVKNFGFETRSFWYFSLVNVHALLFYIIWKMKQLLMRQITLDL